MPFSEKAPGESSRQPAVQPVFLKDVVHQFVEPERVAMPIVHCLGRDSEGAHALVLLVAVRPDHKLKGILILILGRVAVSHLQVQVLAIVQAQAKNLRLLNHLM